MGGECNDEVVPLNGTLIEHFLGKSEQGEFLTRHPKYKYLLPLVSLKSLMLRGIFLVKWGNTYGIYWKNSYR